MDEGTNFLVLKYGKSNMFDCIGNHKKVIEQLGYCWFGKIGKAPGISSLNLILDKEKKTVVLYCQGEAFLCDLMEVSTQRPSEGYPQYYDAFYMEELFSQAFILN